MQVRIFLGLFLETKTAAALRLSPHMNKAQKKWKPNAVCFEIQSVKKTEEQVFSA